MKKLALALGIVVGTMVSLSAFSQNSQNTILKKVYDSEHDETYFVGQFTDIKELQIVEGFQDINNVQLLNKIKETSAQLPVLAQLLEGVKVYLVIGTWCGDSQNWAPEIINVLNLSGLPSNQLTLIALDRNKQGLNNEHEIYNVQYVPTVIFYKGDIEIGRMVESPEHDIMTDFINILKK